MQNARNSAWLKRALLVITLAMTSALPAPTPSAAQIIFLQFKMKNDSITLAKTTVRPGMVKQRRGGAARGDIFYEMLSSSGKLLWSGAMDDPLLQRFEYEDSANSGQLKTKFVKLKEAEFTLRMPFKPEAERIEFYRQNSSEAAQSRQRASRQPLGSIILQLKRGGLQ